MKNRNYIIVAFLLINSHAYSQNYGYLGKKTSIGLQATMLCDIWGVVNNFENRLYFLPEIKVDRCVSRRSQFALSYGLFKSEINTTPGKQIYIYPYFELYDPKIASYPQEINSYKNYRNSFLYQNITAAYNFHFLNSGGTAPLGVNFGLLYNLNIINWDESNYIEYLTTRTTVPDEPYKFENLKLKPALLSATGVGLTSSRVFFNSIKVEIRTGFLFNIRNSITKKSFLGNYYPAINSPEYAIRYFDLERLYRINHSFINYTIGYLF